MLIFYTYVRSENTGHIRGNHARQTADAVDKRHNSGRVVGRQIERVDTHTRVTETHKRHADGKAHGRQHLVASNKRSDHHTQAWPDGS